MSYDIVQEKVPGFIRRLGDYKIEGSNNALIWLGTDRAAVGAATIDDGLGTLESDGKGRGTGTIQIVTGRVDPKGNPNLANDLAYIYVTMKSKIDDNLGLASVEQASNSLPGVIMKSDLLRLVFRKNIKIALDGGKNYVYVDGQTVVVNVNGTKATLTDGKIVLDPGSSGEIDLGGSPTDPVILGQKFLDFINQHLSSEYASHVHPTAMGPSGPPLVPPTQGTPALLSKISKVQ